MTAASIRHRSAPLLAIGLLLAGCGGTPSPALDQARVQLEAAQADVEIRRQAQAALNEAEAALARAERARNAGEDDEEVSHLAYLASQRVEIARALAAERTALERIEELGQARSEMELEQTRARAAELERQLAELQAQETERGYVLTLGDILFAVDQAELTPGGAQQVSRLADFMREFPNRSVVIEGHTDSTGDDAYNLQLSERRAQAVADLLIRQGIDPARMASRGYGEQYPIASNDNVAGRQQNRRVEIVILDPGEAPQPRA